MLRKKKMTLDQMQKVFGIDDPVEFLYVLLGHKSLSNQADHALKAESFTKQFKTE